MGIRRLILDVREPILDLRGVIFGSERVDLSLLGLISGLKEPDLGLSGLGGGTYGRTDVRTDVRKFTPVSYRTSALWGRCPALTLLLQLITPSRALGTADHVQSLDDLFTTATAHPHAALVAIYPDLFLAIVEIHL